MKHFFRIACLLLIARTASAQLAINEVSQGTSGNKEYIELVVVGNKTCTDSTADLRGWIVDDNGGWFGSSAISAGCYRFANVPSWAAVPYGSIILLYNNGDKNGLITQADDATDANSDRVYIVPINAPVIELNGSSPNASMGASFPYPVTGFGASTGWTPMALNNNGDAVVVVNPANPSVPFHAMTYGNISGPTPSVHLTGSGGQRNFYVTGSQYNSAVGWSNGNAPADETPGAPNTAANATWISGMQLPGPGGGGASTLNAAICQGSSYSFNGNSYAAAGTYTIFFPKPGGCDSTVTLNLSVNPVPAAPAVLSPVSLCSGVPAAALAANGLNLKWYETAAASVPLPAAPIPSTAASGMVSYYVSQTVNGCESPRAQIEVIVKPTPAPPQVVSPVDYCQYENALPLSAAGQNLRWYGLAVGGIALPQAPLPATQSPGSVRWYVSQTVDGCESGRSEISVAVHEIDAAFSTAKDTVCSMDTLRLSNLSLGNGLSYQWSFGDGGGGSTEANPTRVYAAPGSYTVKLVTTNSHGCSDSASRTIFILPFPELRFSLRDTVICRGEGITVVAPQITPGYLSLEWDFGDGFQASGEVEPHHSYDTSGLFPITARAMYDGCPERQFSAQVLVNPVPLVQLGRDTTLCPGAAPIRLQSPVLDPAARYVWSTGDTGTITITARTPATYWLRASRGECTAADTVEVLKSCYIDIPNAFTPNGDGDNDYFLPRQLLSRQLSSFHMQLYNRWGQAVFETASTGGRGWDGKLNDVPQPAGVYIYTISATFDNGRQESYQGNVTLLR